MLPASFYTPLYHHGMLLVVISCGLFYLMRDGQDRSLTQFNRVAMLIVGGGIIGFIGFRPVSLAFVDMVDYAMVYARVQQGGEALYPDKLFNGIMRLCVPVLPEAGFFFVCALIYVLPIAVALWRVHGAWAFPAFLACLTAFSFWAYGVNGIRNGMATSVLLLAFAFYDKPALMLSFMAVAWGFHGSVMLPAGAFLIVRYLKRTEIWMAFWLLCVVGSSVSGNVGRMLLAHYNPYALDDRVGKYVLSAVGAGGFRVDFICYSIIPVLATLLLAAPTRARRRRLVAHVMSSSSVNSIRGRRAVRARRGIGLAGPHRASPRGLALAGFDPISGDPRSGLESTSSVQEQSRVLSGQKISARGAGIYQTGWNSLPWVRLLRSDPFYARLVNAYLLTNAIWILVIHAAFSNRFAYLSWFMMPWILLYPFIPSKVIHHPRGRLIAGVLCAQYMFTYLMGVIIDPLRGMR